MREFKEFSNTESVEFVATHFNRLWNSCQVFSSDNREARKKTLLEEYIRVFSIVEPLEVVKYATDKWIENEKFFPAVSEFSEYINAVYDDFVPQEWQESRRKEQIKKFDRPNTLLEEMEKEGWGS